MAYRLLLLSFSALLSFPIGTQGIDWQATIVTAKPSIVRVEVKVGDERGTCTGVVLSTDPGYVATCAHCLKHDAAESIAVTVNGRHATVQAENALLDIAVLSFKAKSEKAVTLAPDQPQPGAPVAVLGFPFGADEVMPQAGIVSGYNHESRLMWLNVEVIFGDSGGLAFDTQARLVGMTSKIFSQGQAHMGAAVPLDAVRDFVEDYLPGAKHPAKPKN